MIAADVPWSYSVFSDKGKGRSAERHYATMDITEIAALPVRELAARDAHLFFWITGPCLARGMHVPVMRSWGFEPSALAFVWLKCKRDAVNAFYPMDARAFAMGMGHTTRQNAEFVILGRRGSPRRLRKDIHQLIIAPRREHSRKPDEFYSRVRDYAAGPYLELFGREIRPAWEVWGDQREKFGSVKTAEPI